jgi:hypothetical protein
VIPIGRALELAKLGQRRPAMGMSSSFDMTRGRADLRVGIGGEKGRPSTGDELTVGNGPS